MLSNFKSTQNDTNFLENKNTIHVCRKNLYYEYFPPYFTCNSNNKSRWACGNIFRWYRYK